MFKLKRNIWGFCVILILLRMTDDYALNWEWTKQNKKWYSKKDKTFVIVHSVWLFTWVKEKGIGSKKLKQPSSPILWIVAMFFSSVSFKVNEMKKSWEARIISGFVERKKSHVNVCLSLTSTNGEDVKKRNVFFFFVCVCVCRVCGAWLWLLLWGFLQCRGAHLCVFPLCDIGKWRLWVGIKRVSELVGTIEIEINLKEGWWWWLLCWPKRREE